jgi:hypothetical protein
MGLQIQGLHVQPAGGARQPIAILRNSSPGRYVLCYKNIQKSIVLDVMLRTIEQALEREERSCWSELHVWLRLRLAPRWR